LHVNPQVPLAHDGDAFAGAAAHGEQLVPHESGLESERQLPLHA
jgi:hypothetical protein